MPELRGLSFGFVTLRFGDASFLVGNTYSRPRKAALSQIMASCSSRWTGSSGCLSIPAERVLRENQHYRILKRVLFGTGDSLAELWEGH